MNNMIPKQLSSLPLSPGVYVFRDAKKKILYVGKAKKLKNRVRSYFNKGTDLTPAKQLMVTKIADIEYTVTDTESEALLLETSLIQKHKPPYNVMLKDDKYWQYIVIDSSGPWTQLYTVRRPEFKKKSHATYFGPYTSGYAVKETMRLIKKIFPICLKLPKNTNPKKPAPCFNHHLGRCLGPCVGEISPENYALLFDDIKHFLMGARRELMYELERKMATYSSKHNFESAGRVRDQITALKKLDRRQKVVLTSHESLDIVSVYRSEERVAINLFKVRDGKLLDKFNTLVKNTDHTDSEIIETFLSQYYQATTDVPDTIILEAKLPVSTDILNIPVRTAQRGKKAQLLKLGTHNAREYLMQQETFFEKTKRATVDAEKALNELKEVLSLSTLPHRIETYDISNIHGKYAVGAMVVAENGTMKKSDYRKFRIKLLNSPDDPRMMEEMLTRRLKNLGSKNKSFASKPDLIVIDGGRTQINASMRALKRYDLDIPLIGLAKREEEIYIPDQKELIILKKNSPALKLLARTRDEAHRFGITYHRDTRNKATLTSELDGIPGIGAKTRTTLLKQFGSISGIKKASSEELAKVIGPSKADLIKEHL